MAKIVFDSYALMVYFLREAGSQKVVQWILKARENKCEILLSLVNWGEIYYSIARAEGEQKARDCLVVIDELSIHVAAVDQELTLDAAPVSNLNTRFLTPIVSPRRWPGAKIVRY